MVLTSHLFGEKMKLYQGIFQWEGWGGVLKLASGKCQLTLYDLSSSEPRHIIPMETAIAVVSDIDEPRRQGQWVSIRSCAAHIATQVVEKFDLKPQRLLWIEYTPEKAYGPCKEKVIPESYSAVKFEWRQKAAFNPVRKPLDGDRIRLIESLQKT